MTLLRTLTCTCCALHTVITQSTNNETKMVHNAEIIIISTKCQRDQHRYIACISFLLFHHCLQCAFLSMYCVLWKITSGNSLLSAFVLECYESVRHDDLSAIFFWPIVFQQNDNDIVFSRCDNKFWVYKRHPFTLCLNLCDPK